jgi:glycosyltransferase involved in cell wall biosynthesis
MRPKWDAVDCEIEVPYLKKVVEPKVAIFTLTYNRLSETTVSFGTLHNTANYPFTHIVVDNGSSDGTVEYLKEYAKDKDVQLIINADNKGISIASNQALDWAKGKYDIIVKVDNDAIFKTKKWLSKMVEIWKANRKIALSCYVSGLRDNPGGAPRVVYGTIKGELVGMARHLGGITHFVDARAYDEFRWPEEETLHGNQDVEFSMYLTSQNYQMAYLENYFVNHGLDGTEGQMKKHKDYFEKRKWEKCHVYGDKYEK